MTATVLKNPTLFLHVGYGKTGSTAIQEWLAGQQHAMESAGIAYPMPLSGVGDSGNGSMLLEALKKPTQRPLWLSQDQSGFKSWLFSREQFAREWSEPGQCEQLARWAQLWGFGSVEILLFVRDPFEHCYSLWAQKVKRAGESRSLSAFANNYDAITMASKFVKQASESKFKVHILDYGRHREELLLTCLRWLEAALPENISLSAMVNSSLSRNAFVNVTPCRRQLELQRQLNKFFPVKKAYALSRVLQTLPIPAFRTKKNYLSIIERWHSEVIAFNSVSSQYASEPEAMPCSKPIDTSI